MKQLKEYDYNSIDARSSTTPDSQFVGRMKGSRRLEVPNTVISKGAPLRPTAKGSIEDDLGSLPGTEDAQNLPAREPLLTIPHEEPHLWGTNKKTRAATKPVIAAKKEKHDVLRDFIRRQVGLLLNQ